jgi:hypothetical protein
MGEPTLNGEVGLASQALAAKIAALAPCDDVYIATSGKV